MVPISSAFCSLCDSSPGPSPDNPYAPSFSPRTLPARAQLMPETLFLACALIDRYLARAQVARKNLQLVSAGAACIAHAFSYGCFP